MRPLSLTLLFDNEDARSSVNDFLCKQRNGRMLSPLGVTDSAGPLPARVGDFFYSEPWIIYGDAGREVSPEWLPAFNADLSKLPSEIASAVDGLSQASEWAVLPCGGYATFGMIGIICDGSLELSSSPIARYDLKRPFASQYRGLLFRNFGTGFDKALWKAVNGNQNNPTVVTFHYFEGSLAPNESLLSFSIISSSDVAGQPLTAYRCLDEATLGQMIALRKNTDLLHILPGSLDESDLWKMTGELSRDTLDMSKLIETSPWLLSFNCGELDTDNGFFFARDHSLTGSLAKEAGDSANVIACF